MSALRGFQVAGAESLGPENSSPPNLSPPALFDPLHLRNHLDHFLLELDKPEINLGSLAIVDTPFDKGCESTQVEWLTVCLDDRLELTSQGGELVQRIDCKIHADSGRLVLGHL